jgi:hypothetical protein
MNLRPKRFYKQSSPLVAKMVRDLYFIGRLKQHEIGRMFGMRQNSVSRIVSGQVWRDHGGYHRVRGTSYR